MKKVFAIVCLLLVFSLAGCQTAVFDGSKSMKENQFILEYRVLNMTETAEMQLSEGDIIDVQIVSNSGKVDVFVKSNDGSEIYRGNNAGTGSFKLTIPQTGSYTFSVTGSHANGGVSFVKE